MDWFWHAWWVCVVVIPVTVMWIAIGVELFRRRDLTGLQRAMWIVLLLLFPILASLAYVAVTWREAKPGRDAKMGTEVSAQPSDVDDLTRLDQLRRAGVVTEDEFERGKRRVLEGSRR